MGAASGVWGSMGTHGSTIGGRIGACIGLTRSVPGKGLASSSVVRARVRCSGERARQRTARVPLSGACTPLPPRW